MAISAAAKFEIRTTATAGNANGGFFVTGATGTDYSQQDAAQYNLTGATTAGAGAVVLHASASADMVGNGVRISGTNFTSSWYEIISVVAGVSFTTDRNCATGVGAAGVCNIGGALSMGAAGTFSDDAVFELAVPGNIFYVKSGTYTLGIAVTIVASGSAASVIKIIGYNSTRGDAPTLTNRPKFILGAARFTAGNYWQIYHMEFTGSTDFTLLSNSYGVFYNCKATNTATTANYSAFYVANFTQAIACEGVSIRGYAIYLGGFGSAFGCYFHDSNIGAYMAGNYKAGISSCIISQNVVAAIRYPAGAAYDNLISNNTLYGSTARIGVGVDLLTSAANQRLINNVISGFVSGVVHADAGNNDTIKSMFNSYYNNGTDVTNIVKDVGDIALDPQFVSVSEITGSNGTTSGAVLTSSGADFSSVVDNQDYCHLISGTGVTLGKYAITAHSATTLTLSPSPGTDATADKVYSVGIGHNYAVGANMSGAAYPGIFDGGLTTGYLTIGAAQRSSSGGGSTYASSFNWSN